MRTRNAMSVRRFLILGVICSSFCIISAAHADQSQFVNAKLETHAVGQGLQNEVAQISAGSPQPTWIAYEVPAVPSNESNCCGNYRGNGEAEVCRTCTLEKQQDTFSVEKGQNTTVKLEGSPQLTVLLRVDQKQVMRIRMASSNCTMMPAAFASSGSRASEPDESVGLLTAYAIRKDHPAMATISWNSRSRPLHTMPTLRRSRAHFFCHARSAGLAARQSFFLARRSSGQVWPGPSGKNGARRSQP